MTDLAADLRRAIRGEVRFDAGSRALYSTDSSNYRQVPIGVVIPRDIEDVIRTIELARAHGAPILSRGGGTSLAGQCCNVAVVLDFSKYVHRILQVDPEKRKAIVEPGVVLDQLRDAAENFHITFGPDPATHSRCTLGGMIGNNSCGVHSVYSGKTDENVEELEILTYRGLRLKVGATSDDQLSAFISGGGEIGQIYSKLKSLRDRYAELIRKRYPNIPRRVSGYNLNELLPENGFHVARALVGSESTLVTVLQATVRLVESPPVRNLLALGFSDIATAGDFVPEILQFKPLALEGLDDRLIDAMKKKQLLTKNVSLLPPGNGWLLVEFGGQNEPEANASATRLIQHLKTFKQAPAFTLFENPAQA